MSDSSAARRRQALRRRGGSPSPRGRRRIPFSNRESTKDYLNLGVMLLFLVVITILFFDIMHNFIFPILLAVTFSSLTWPLFQGFNRRLWKGRHRGISAFLFCLLLVVVILVPLIMVARMVIDQGIAFYAAADHFVRTAIQEPDYAFLHSIQDHRLLSWINWDWVMAQIQQINWQKSLQQALTTSGRLATGLVNRTSSGLLTLGMTLFLMIYTMFYFFKDGEKIVARLRYLSPLRDKYEEELIERFGAISRATIKGTLVIGLIQAFCGTITFIIFAVPGWILWGVVMLILSIIPLVGMFLVMAPVALYKIIIGQTAAGIIILVVGIGFNYAIDYLLRPGLVGKESKMHDLLIFFSTMGGLALFGIMGFVIGPMITMIFITLLDIYGAEFKELLSGKL